jgi:serpin B
MATRKYTVLALFLLVLTSFTLVGCSKTSAANVKMALAEVPRESPQLDQGLLDQQVAANNEFAFDLYRNLAQKDGNLFYSPYSVSLAVVMAFAGARGETEQQIMATMRYALPQPQLHQAFNQLDQSLNSPEGEASRFQLAVANSLWGQDGFPFRADFLELIARNYGAGVRLVDFTSDAKREAARQAINKWVSQLTNDQIKDLLSKGMLDDLTRLVLVNAIYFKAEWLQSFFESYTTDAPFTLLSGEQVEVPTMADVISVDYFQGDGFQAIGLAYKGDRAEMIVILPEPGTITAFEAALDRATFDRILEGFERKYIKLYLPKFQFEYSQDLDPSLAEMGMPVAFTDQADFSGLYDPAGLPPLYISKIVHKTFIAVDEIGTEAAAATGVTMKAMALIVPALELKIDHPFIFAIRDRQTGTILFVGRMVDPREGK